MSRIHLGSISTIADASERQQAEAKARARAGVVETISTAKSQRVKVALVTTTAEQNIASLIQALSPAIERAQVDIIGTSASVERPKPDRAA
jgi:beta-phosphoglucomutase-like phosphatase (HAD superfamily)